MNASVDKNTLKDLAASESIFAQGTNDLGEIVGYYFDHDDLVHGYLSSNGTIVRLDHPDATQGTFAESINNAGDIVGYFYDDNDIAHGFFYSEGCYLTLDDPSAVFGTFAEAINDHGDIVGFYYDGSSQPHPCAMAAYDSGLAELAGDLGSEPINETPTPAPLDAAPIRDVSYCYQSTFLIDEVDHEPAPLGAEMIAETEDVTVTATVAEPPAPPAAARLNGYVDRVTDLLVEGWAQNPDKPEEPVCLDVSIDGKIIETTLANRYRADLVSAGLGSGRHAFSVRLPATLTAKQLEGLVVRRSSDQARLTNAFARSATRAA